MTHLLMIRIKCDSGNDTDPVDAALSDARPVLQGIVAQMVAADFVTPVPKTKGLYATEIRDENNEQVAIITLQEKG